ncbi:MAG: add [Rubritepida sp.]|nr:add [Rubritepida sp.]
MWVLGLLHGALRGMGGGSCHHAALPVGSSRRYVRGMSDALDTFCLALPKVDLHVHLLGAVRQSTFAEMAAGCGIGAAEIEALYAGEVPRALEQRVLRDPSDLHRITYEHLQDAAAHGVRHSEISWNPTGTQHLFPYARGADAILAGFADAATDFGVSALLIPAIDREDTPEAATQLAGWMLGHRRDAIVGLGIDYRETDRPPELFWKAWRMAKGAGFRLTAQAGESGCHPRNIETAIELLEVERIDHGYTVLEDPALTARCAERGILFTVVPSNPDYQALDHPIRRMPAAGLLIHPGTDAPALYQVTPTRCWRMMVEDFGFGIVDLRDFMLNGIRGSFLPEPSRRHLEAAFSAEFDALAAECFPEGVIA